MESLKDSKMSWHTQYITLILIYQFNIHLQKELDVLEKYFPTERKQCEIIWKPVYDEYRRIGYRLKDNEDLRNRRRD